MASVALRFPPGLNIHYNNPSVDQENMRSAQQQQFDQQAALWEIQPRIRKLQLPIRTCKLRSVTMQVDGTSILRKKLGHATVMIACARQRVNRRRAAQQAAVYARLFNFTGEWADGLGTI